MDYLMRCPTHGDTKGPAPAGGRITACCEKARVTVLGSPLEAAQDRYLQAQAQVKERARERAKVAAQAREWGASVSAIAEVLGVTRQRADQIIRSVHQHKNPAT